MKLLFEISFQDLFNEREDNCVHLNFDDSYMRYPNNNIVFT